jgi:hypothetical protein
VSGPAAALWLALLHLVPPPAFGNPGPFFERYIMGYTWRTREDGIIVVYDDGDLAMAKILTLSGPNAEGMEHVEARWGELCRRIGGRHGIRDGWIQAMIWRESGGNPQARNPETKPGNEDDGVGLLQITSGGLKAGHSDAELQDPETNIEIGAAFIASLVKRYGDDFPKVSAAFNAGSVRAPLRGFENPWGMMQTSGHVTAEVCALNYYLQRSVSDADRASTLALVYATTQDILQHDFERGETEPPTQREGKTPKA